MVCSYFALWPLWVVLYIELIQVLKKYEVVPKLLMGFGNIYFPENVFSNIFTDSFFKTYLLKKSLLLSRKYFHYDNLHYIFCCYFLLNTFLSIFLKYQNPDIQKDGTHVECTRMKEKCV